MTVTAYFPEWIVLVWYLIVSLIPTGFKSKAHKDKLQPWIYHLSAYDLKQFSYSCLQQINLIASYKGDTNLIPDSPEVQTPAIPKENDKPTSSIPPRENQTITSFSTMPTDEWILVNKKTKKPSTMLKKKKKKDKKKTVSVIPNNYVEQKPLSEPDLPCLSDNDSIVTSSPSGSPALSSQQIQKYYSPFSTGFDLGVTLQQRHQPKSNLLDLLNPTDHNLNLIQ
ncbi:hypothetical protein EDC96DRAFT_576680 [Choanephora cucurbitarum]|nr:hypothetical protein EDC96DRAFT_576680 [Choanephora cucurbitarum]